MVNGTVWRLALVGVIMMIGTLASDSFGADAAKDSSLSKALAEVKLFAGLTRAERDALESAATLRRGRAGERIIEQGKISGRMFIVMEGKAEVWVNKRHIVTLSGQALLGEIEFLDKAPASADVVLIQETDIIELNNEALNVLMEKQPRLGYVLIREIARIEARRLRNTNPK